MTKLAFYKLNRRFADLNPSIYEVILLKLEVNLHFVECMIQHAV